MRIKIKLHIIEWLYEKLMDTYRERGVNYSEKCLWIDELITDLNCEAKEEV